MEHAEAVTLIRDGVTGLGGVWADLGAGSGVFSRALAELIGSGGTVYAVDKRVALASEEASPTRARIVSVRGDFTEPLPYAELDGIVMTNALHFVRRQERVLRQVAGTLKPGGVFILVEYDVMRGNPWVPFPVSLERFNQMAERSGLSEPQEIGRLPSRYWPRGIYAAVATRG